MTPAHCPDCPIKHRGFCDAFGTLLGKFVAHMAARYGAVIPEDRREQILGEVIEAVLRDIQKFEGRRGAKFATWAWHIGRNKIADYFRRHHASHVPEAAAPEWLACHNPRNKIEMKLALSGCFRAHLATDPKGCVRLFLDLYRSFLDGRDQKDLAAAYGLKPNTFNQRLKRCREVLRQLFEECLEEGPGESAAGWEK